MKVYSIGREAGCDIVISDSTDVVSRRHAILNVAPSGKMTIVDQSHNGTYVNGIRISPNVPVPVTRKDNVSFAHVARLNWDMVPKGSAAVWKYVVIAVAAIALVVGGVFLTKALVSKKAAPVEVTAPVDSAAIKQKEAELKKQEDEKAKDVKNDKEAKEGKKQQPSAGNKTDNKKNDKTAGKDKPSNDQKSDKKEEPQPKRLR